MVTPGQSRPRLSERKRRRSNADWHLYQEKVAEFYRSVGFDARTNISIAGARASHDVDVLLTLGVGGSTVLWVVECKLWSRPIPKERILTLEGVVKDIGADRGVLVAESGFQAGAIRAARHNNLTLTSLEDLRQNTAAERTQTQVAILAVRIAKAARAVSRLWPWTKPQTPSPSIDFEAVLDTAGKYLELQQFVAPRIMSDEYPIRLPGETGRPRITNQVELLAILTPYLDNVEREIDLLKSQAFEAFKTANDLGRQLGEQLSALNEAGRQLSTSKSESSAASFLRLMQLVDETASSIIRSTPSGPSGHVRALMRQLIDGTYLMALEESAQDWATESALVDGHLRAFMEALAELRPDVANAR